MRIISNFQLFQLFILYLSENHEYCKYYYQQRHRTKGRYVLHHICINDVCHCFHFSRCIYISVSDSFKAFVNSFLARFGDSRGEAERIINDVLDAPHRLQEFLIELNQLYTVIIGVQGVEDCCVALIFAGHWYMARQIRDSRESLPVSEIEQSNVPDTDSSVGMSVDSSNVVMGSVTTDENETGSTESMDASNTLTASVHHGNGGTDSVESMGVP